MKSSISASSSNVYILGYGMCGIGVTKDNTDGHADRWGVIISHLDRPLSIGDHITQAHGQQEFCPAVIVSDGRDGMRVLLRAVMKAYAELGGDDPLEVWEDSKRFFAEVAEKEKENEPADQ